MENYNEIEFLNKILNKVSELDLLDEAEKILVDATIITKLANGNFAHLNNITLKEVVKLETLLNIEFITIVK